jgi:hypothetical protein
MGLNFSVYQTPCHAVKRVQEKAEMTTAVLPGFFSVAEMTGSGIGRQWQIGAAAC